jgi:FtsH-binding integral membrane protein
MTYAKMIAQILATAVSAAVVALTTDGAFSDVELINIAIAAVGAVGVFYVPNAPNGPVAKAVVAVLMAVLTLAVNLIVDGVTLSEWLQLVVAALGAIGVYGVRNDPRPAHAV